MEEDDAKSRSFWSVNIGLLKAKLFFFFFYASTGSLDPYLALYYKHTLLLSPRQIGILLGIRPCCLLVSSPILGTIADKLNRFRAILLLCLSAYIITYTTVILVEPVEGFNCASSKHLRAHNITVALVSSSPTSPPNNTPRIQHDEFSNEHRSKRSIDSPFVPYDSVSYGDAEFSAPWFATKFQVKGSSKHIEASLARDQGRKTLQGHYHGTLMGDLYFSWPFSLYDYKIAELFTWKLFTLLLLITVVGELIASPARTFADLYAVQALEEKTEMFGHQLIPGVIGWAIVGTVLRLTHHNKVIESTGICGKGLVLNGKPFFFSFFFFMVGSILVAVFFKYRRYGNGGRESLVTGCSDCKFFQSLFALARNTRYFSFLIVVALCGVGDGMKTQFLYSYLSDLTGFKIIYPTALAVQFVSQVVVLYVSPWLLAKFRQPILICFGLLCYGITFSVYSFAENGWMVLAVEPIDGFARKLTYVALVTYVGSPPRVGAAMQGVVHGIYIGLGTSIGGFLGALSIMKYGYFAVFISLGIAFLIFFGIYLGHLHLFPHDGTIGENFTDYDLLAADDAEGEEEFTEKKIATKSSEEYIDNEK